MGKNSIPKALFLILIVISIISCAGIGTYVLKCKAVNNPMPALDTASPTQVYTETWTTGCIAKRGDTCKGAPRILIKPGFKYCDHGQEMYNVSTCGYKEFHISEVTDNCVEWYIRTVGQDDGGPATVEAEIWVKGISADATPEERKANGCKNPGPTCNVAGDVVQGPHVADSMRLEKSLN